MKDKTKKILTSVSIVVLLAGIGTALAYLISTDGNPNQVKIGKGDADIVETFDPPKKLTTDANIYQKLVTIKNEGKNPSFVRVFMDFTDTAVKSGDGVKTYFFVPDDINSIPTSAPGKGTENADGTWTTTGGKWVEANKWSPSGDWVYVDEGGLSGYYYYKEPVAPGASTPPLISWVRTDFDDESKITDYEILVYSETVQTVEINESGTVYDASTYQTAWQEYLRVEPFVSLKAGTFAESKTASANTGTIWYNTACYTADIANGAPDSFSGMFENNTELVGVDLDIDLRDDDDDGGRNRAAQRDRLAKSTRCGK